MPSAQNGSVAVVIPVYNGERFIRRALESVFAQTLQPAEIFVVDDGSTDTTLRILAEDYGARADAPGRITVISQRNGGPARARNAASRQAKSEFIAFLDADDWWEPRKLEVQVSELRARADAVVHYTALRVVRESDGHVQITPAIRPEHLMPSLRWNNPGIPPACVMVRRVALVKAHGFDERQIGSEDWSLWFKLRLLGPFCVSQDPLTDYRLSPGGLSGNADHMFNDFMKMLDDVLLSGFTGWQRKLWRRRIIAFQALRGAMTARAAGDTATEWKYMRLSLRTWPSPFWAPERMKLFAVTLMRGR